MIDKRVKESLIPFSHILSISENLSSGPVLRDHPFTQYSAGSFIARKTFCSVLRAKELFPTLFG